MTTLDTEILISNILDHFLRQCQPDSPSVSSASVKSVLPPPGTREIFDLTAEMDASSISSVSTSPRIFSQATPLGIDNITSVRYNPMVEHDRNKDMLKKLEKKDILTLFSKFDAYKVNGGLFSLYQFIDPKQLKIAFYDELPPVKELLNDVMVREQLQLWIPPQTLSQLKEEFKAKVAMSSTISKINDFKEAAYIRYKGEMMLF
jgi:hypothetical protein